MKVLSATVGELEADQKLDDEKIAAFVRLFQVNTIMWMAEPEMLYFPS